MKVIYKISLFLLIIISLAACRDEYQFSIKTTNKAILNDKITINLVEENGNPFEKALFFINGKEISSDKNSLTIDTKDYGVGKQNISAMVYYGEGKKSKKVSNFIEVFSSEAPIIYTYKLINTYPHDTNAYTQGLEYHNGFLYETTGQLKKSSLRKVELTTGKVLQKTNLEDNYFGEGMTIFDNKIHMLTWKSGKGFVYNFDSFQRETEFKYGKSKEGWGLTHNENELIKSDGTSKIWFLDPTTHKEKRSIQVYTDKRKIPELNELEYINGKIYANWWITKKPIQSVIVIINPKNGVVEGVINLKGLRETILKEQKLKDDYVLNGIAYDTANNRLFVTGKNWSKLFEIELIKQQ